MRVKILILNLILIVIKLSAAATNKLSSDQAGKQAFFNALSSTLAENKVAVKKTGYIRTDFSSMPIVPVSVLPSGDYIKDCKNCTCRNNTLDCLCNNQKTELNYKGLCNPDQNIIFLDNNLTPTSGYWYEFCKLNSFINSNLPATTSNPIFANIVTANLNSFRDNVLPMTNLYTKSKNTSTSTSTSTSTLNPSTATTANNYNADNLAASLTEKLAGEQLIVQQKQALQAAECSNKQLFYNFKTSACDTAEAISAPCTSTGSKVYNFSTGDCQEAGLAQNIADCKFINGVYEESTGNCDQTKFEKTCQNTGGYFDSSSGICDRSGPESSCQNKNGKFNKVTGLCDQSAVITSCKKIKGTFLPTFGECDQSIAQNTCINIAGGDFNDTTGSCSNLPLSEPCKNTKGVFTYNYNSDNTAINTNCDQKAAIKSCSAKRGKFGPLWPETTGTCNLDLAQNTCINIAGGDYNSTTGSCSNLPLSEPCKNAKGVFTYNYNSDNTAINTNCDQKAAIKSCSDKRGKFGPLWPETTGTCNLDSAAQNTCINIAGGDYNATTGSCSNLSLSEPCKNAKGVFTYNYNSDNTAINTNCDQKAAIKSCSDKRGKFGPLWPETTGTCDLSSAQDTCINTAGGNFDSTTGVCSDCPLTDPMNWCINEANGYFNNNGLNSTCISEDGSSIPFTSGNPAERYLGCP